ncbi:hypothetical protein CXT76_00685 [Candidatus Parvarchaeota archaeon]|jgi:hypothetical protein|nr:MAG: hypothetical protein CXT76_00685 [Candidatus Parvarchaeota archaeon]HIG52346.1 hypothetical protein [Candidatus Pacearchaeota archaeon]
MNVIGFNFTRISANKENKKDKLEKINSNLEFTNIAKESIDMLKEAHVAKIDFKYNIDYQPTLAAIDMEGVILIKSEEKEVDNLIKTWKKNKMEDEVKIPLFNLILKKCSIKALQLEEELNLPQHIQLPKLQKKIE